MKYKSFILFVFLSLTQEGNLTLSVRKYVNHKDMSEYCRRQVMPSMFLGKQVKDSNLNIIYFSKLELPYSCTVTVRAESGNSIILVIRRVTELSLKDACSKNQDQLIVYELGETFGGYWGPLPDEIINPPITNEMKYYTIKTTLPSTTSSTTPSEEDETENSTIVLSATDKSHVMEEDEYVTVEVPLVNISGNLQLVNRPFQHVDEIFDAIYDVTPQKDVEYRTTLIPLVKFSIHRQTEGQNDFNISDQNGFYDLDYGIKDNGFTLDSRLIFSTAHKRILTKKSNWLSNRRLHFKDKNIKTFKQSTIINYFNRQFTKQRVSLRENTSRHVVKSFREEHTPVVFSSNYDKTTDSNFIDNITNSYNLSTTSTVWKETTTRALLLDKIPNLKNSNKSAYLLSNLALYNGHVRNDHLQTSSKNHLEASTTRFSILSSLDGTKTDFTNIKSTIPFKNANVKDDNITAVNITTRNNDILKIKPEKQEFNINTLNITLIEDQENNTLKKAQKNITESVTSSTDFLNLKRYQNLSSVYTTNKAPITGPLVNRESWENIVQVAPVMATALNKTSFQKNQNTSKVPKLNENIKIGNRTKRYIRPLEFEQPQPHNLTWNTSTVSPVTEKAMFSDMQDLAQLVEVQDDEVQGRIALRHLRNYIGPKLFNICDFEHGKTTPNVHLLNSSRILISINNFTLDRMMLIVTPALALLNNKAQCPPSQLECQIMGTRVCIDSVKACDGIPNCGSNDIYDEDRITCGGAASTQYVIFAAFAFLVVVFTIIYIIYYWLMRCVPKVSEAFFVYTDDSENTLRLRTVMRGPTGDDDEYSQKFYFPRQFFDNDPICHGIAVKKEESSYKKSLRKCFYCILCKQTLINDEKLKEDNQDLEILDNKLQSIELTEIEFKRSAVQKDEMIQTGRSLEMKTNTSRIETLPINIVTEKYVDELSLINLVNEKRSSLENNFDLEQKMKENPIDEFADANEELEMDSTFYERRDNLSILSRKESYQKAQLRKYDEESIEKHLRFIEQPTLIPDLKISEEQLAQSHIQPSFSGLDSRTKSKNLLKRESKESKNYWKLPKSEKSKKGTKM